MVSKKMYSTQGDLDLYSTRVVKLQCKINYYDTPGGEGIQYVTPGLSW
jgi:hypothetical protein